MMAGLFVIFTLIWTLNPAKFGIFIVSQIVLAIPLLFVSSLSYSKLGYWKEFKLWEILGWFTNNTGNIFILNVAGLMAASVNRNLALIYFALIIILMFIYSSINVFYRRSTLKEKIFKFSYFIVILAIGGILPLFL
jgi:hypothetical protein